MENERPSTANTPSRLRPPRARKDVCSLAESAGMGEGRALMGPDDGGGADRSGAQKPRIHSPRSERAKLAIALPEAIPAPADPRVKTYRSSATATGRPQPVTKPAGSRPPPRTAAMGRPTVPRGAAYSAAEAIATHSGQRPLWDHKGRLEEMEKVVANLKDRVESTSLVSTSVGRELEEARAKVRTLEEDKEHLQAKLSRKERELEDLGEELQRLQRQQERILADRMLEHQESLARLQAQLQEAVEARERLSLECQSCRRELASVSAECAALKTTLSTQSATILNGEAQFRALQTQKHGLDQQVAEQEGMISTLQEMIAGLQQELHTAGRKLQEGETLRRKLHNTVQELKGNIRVFCRVRPMLNGEGGGGGNDLAASHIDIGLDLERQQEEIRLTQWSESAAGNQISKVYPFTFDKVFGPGATQGDVFGEISQLVQSALDGYRVCIFAYGQTGSGKTFTMEGDAGDLERLGMIPRAVEQIFASTELLREKGWSFGFEASYLEIYNETIRDLLAARAAADAECKYDIRHVDGNTTVSELTVVPVSAPSQILDLLRKAAANRAVAETLCNERSSRSHSVFTLRIRGENGVTTEKIEGLLHLVDLAGSERLGQSGSTGERLKETQAINKSLSSLGDVIHAIANREAHVPYRNSKLTFLLQNSLGGNCKTLMFVNISPAPASLGESLCSLRFAAKVNACQIGTASRKVTK